MSEENKTIINCPSCGAKNAAAAQRCGSCGAPTEELKAIHSEARERERRYQQEGFSVPWAVIALVVQVVLTGAVVVALPQAAGALDFEGYYGMSLTIPVWCVGGFLVGLISPGKTFIEPVVAALIVAFPTVFFLYNGIFGALGHGQTVRTMPWFMYVIMAAIGVMFTLIGAYAGERVQMGPQAARSD
jgi:ribosomal protein L40E